MGIGKSALHAPRADYPAGPGEAVGTGCVALPAQQHAVAMVQSEVACGMILQEFRGKSPGLPPPKGLSRQAPWGFTTYYQNQTPPLLQKRLVGGNASPAETFLQFKTCFNAQHESPSIMAHGDQLIQAPFVG